MTGGAVATPAAAEALDLAAYGARVGWAGPATPTVETLQTLVRAHVTGIPFENVDVLLGRGVSLEPEAVADKLVRRGRGGYCFEHCLLFAAVLARVGFGVTPLLSRVRPDAGDDAALRTHMTLHVTAEGEDWIADVGFGASMPVPIRLAHGATASYGGWRHRLDEAAGAWTLSEEGSATDGGAAPRHRFTLEPVTRADLEVANHYTSTHPRSPFTRAPVVFRTTSHVRHRLHGTHLTTTDGRSEASREVGVDDLPAVLSDVLGLALSRDDVGALQRRVAAHRPARGS